MRPWGWLEAHLESDDVSRVIYGSIIGLALIVGLQIHPPSNGEIIGLIMGTALAVGLAELYSDIVATEAKTRKRLTRAERRHLAGEVAAVIFGAGFPVVFFLLASTGAIEQNTAFRLAKWTGLGLICSYGFAAARLAGASVGRAVLHAAFVGAIGGALIGLKAALH